MSNIEPKYFDSIKFITEFGCAQIEAAVLFSLGYDSDSEEIEDICDKQLSLLYEAAEAAIFHNLWNYSSFLSFYPFTRFIFAEIEEKKEWRDRVSRLRRPGASGRVTVYCPRGCNQITVDADEPWDECAACGQLMTSRYEDSYYESLVLSGQVQ